MNTPRTSTYDLLEGLLTYVEQRPSGCVVWTGAQISGGYGTRNGKLVQRTAYEILVGPIPPNRFITTTCRNKLCVAPTHLIVVRRPPTGARSAGTVRPKSPQRCTKCGIVGHNSRSCENQL